jgi:hypothetical protein
MAINDGLSSQPLLFTLLKGPRGGGTVAGRQAGGFGPFRPWLKPNIRTTLDQTDINPDGWRNPQLPKPILFAIRSKLNPMGRGRNLPLPALGVTLSGVSRDSTGVALGGVTCTLFQVDTLAVGEASGRGNPLYVQVAQTVSDGSGNYTFVVGFDGPYRVTFDLDGAPVRAGLTLNTLSGI